MKTSALFALTLLLGSVSMAAPAADIAAGKEKSTACAACHGADGNSTDPQYPRLAGQHANYLERALLDYQAGARKNPIMAGMVGGLTKDDITNLAAYYASQPGVVTPVQGRGVAQ